MNSSTTEIRVFTQSKTVLFLLGRLPNKIKRAVILISLAAKVQKINPEDTDILAAINKSLNLVEHDESLKFPVAVKELIWVNIEPVKGEINALREAVDSTSRLKEFAAHLAKKIPASLCYASEGVMGEDFYRLFHARV